MTKDQLQGIVVSLINLIGNIPGWIVYIYLLNKVEMPVWIWLLYFGGLVWSTFMGCISLIITYTATTNSYKESLKQFQEEIEKMVK